MGFGTIFATTVMVVILGISTYLFITGAVFSMDTWSNSLKEMNKINNERLKTEIDLGDMSVTSSEYYTRSYLNVSITNTGSTKILNHDFSHIDVFVYYYNCAGAENITIHRWIPYNSSLAFSSNYEALGDNEWTVVRITPDSINPRVFDPDEQLEIVIRVCPAIDNSSAMQNRTKIVMPNGVADAEYF